MEARLGLPEGGKEGGCQVYWLCWMPQSALPFHPCTVLSPEWMQASSFPQGNEATLFWGLWRLGFKALIRSHLLSSQT